MRWNFSPARNVRSTTAPVLRFFTFVRTNAPPLPGLTCWNSTMRHTEPSSSMCIPFLNWFVNGMHIELDGSVWRIVEFQHVKPGKGGAFVRTKVKALESGAVVERTFRAGEKFTRIRTE